MNGSHFTRADAYSSHFLIALVKHVHVLLSLLRFFYILNSHAKAWTEPATSSRVVM